MQCRACRSAPWSGTGSPGAQGLAPDRSWPEDRNVFKVFAPDEAVVKVTVAEVLELVPLVWLGRIVLGVFGGVGGDNRSPLIDVKRYVAFEVN